jgi:hypothetical protein
VYATYRELKGIADSDACVECHCYLAFLLVAKKQSVREFLHQDMLVPWHHSDRARTQHQQPTTAAAATTTSSSTSSQSSESSKCSIPATEQAYTSLSPEV